MNTQQNTKRILVYGDSYTFGKIPGGLRFPNNIRYTGVLQKELGESFEVIEEGLRGRVLDGENSFFPFRNGFEQFGPILGSHLPLDLIVFLLGTNDANSGSMKTPEEIVNGYYKYLERIDWWCKHLGFERPKILIVAPPSINEKESYKAFNDIFKGSEEKIAQLPILLKDYALKNNLLYFDASSIISISPIDGIHLDEQANRILGENLAEYIQSEMI